MRILAGREGSASVRKINQTQQQQQQQRQQQSPISSLCGGGTNGFTSCAKDVLQWL